MLDAQSMVRKAILNVIRLSGLDSVSRPILGGAGAILMLHRVNAKNVSPLRLNDYLCVTPDFLDQAIGTLKRMGYAVLPMDELVEALRGPSRSSRFIAITFDDGYLDNLTDALPVLEAHQAPAIIYVTSGLTSGSVLPWWEVVEDLVVARDRLYVPTPRGKLALDCSSLSAKRASAKRLSDYITAELPESEIQGLLHRMIGPTKRDQSRRSFMNWDEIRAIARHPLVSIGAHTVTHPNLRRVSESEVRSQMADSIRAIEVETGLAPVHFAYPYGSTEAAGEREVRIAGEVGFASAVTTRHGVLQPGHAGHLHALPRISLNGRFQKVGHLRAMLSGLTTPLANQGRRLVTV